MTAADDKAPLVRLLIVDEDPISLKTLPPSLRLFRYDVAVVSSAAEALAAIDTHRPAVVLLEWAFRDGSGAGLAARLRARAAAQGRTLVIIAFSVVDEPDGFCEREAIDRYFVKPVTIKVIDRAIRPLLLRVSDRDATSR